ncbi:MAG: nucleoside deaminase [Inquilinus sp.]|nr:nucleoside deaminase [Inquilinus sp.]
MSDPRLIDRMLETVERNIVPLTEQGVKIGNKVFGAAILRKSDLSLVIAGTNNETANPLWHGEIHTLKLLYEMPRAARPKPAECLFLSTHEPCSMCLSAITWAGYDNFTYLFSHEDSRDSFSIPHDLRILKQVFTLDAGGYAKTNEYWSCFDLMNLIAACNEGVQAGFTARVDALKRSYAEMSDIYQANKGDNEIPLK